MSRNFIPAALAIGVGILTGYYTFHPALQELQIEKRKPLSAPACASDVVQDTLPGDRTSECDFEGPKLGCSGQSSWTAVANAFQPRRTSTPFFYRKEQLSRECYTLKKKRYH
ncbi:uncharacterized protein AFUA_2G12950 [Aspergillus fumigatus Af293]|uniref:Uncharacterized protein n=1 Tax=Aspergillus fumigatus (strain ATCC MYA-4609 / CBS 101355 / FGSC A1100 / Af293) TaxID=330879 RepID=Q4X0M7_ASPFU|nr:hypothetical protein AFUA_2G12950 [Aspergillus fumigatus Af293]EAL93588.1 hypothetical protein AFUA_2G12950 [Aspergillus fumigatus Af293]